MGILVELKTKNAVLWLEVMLAVLEEFHCSCRIHLHIPLPSFVEEMVAPSDANKHISYHILVFFNTVISWQNMDKLFWLINQSSPLTYPLPPKT